MEQQYLNHLKCQCESNGPLRAPRPSQAAQFTAELVRADTPLELETGTQLPQRSLSRDNHCIKQFPTANQLESPERHRLEVHLELTTRDGRTY